MTPEEAASSDVDLHARLDALEAALSAAAAAEREAVAAWEASERAAAAADEAVAFADEVREALAEQPAQSGERCEAPTPVDCGDGRCAPSVFACVPADHAEPRPDDREVTEPEAPSEDASDVADHQSEEGLANALVALAASHHEGSPEEEDAGDATGTASALGFVGSAAFGGAFVLIVMALRRWLRAPA